MRGSIFSCVFEMFSWLQADLRNLVLHTECRFEALEPLQQSLYDELLKGKCRVVHKGKTTIRVPVNKDDVWIRELRPVDSDKGG